MMDMQRSWPFSLLFSVGGVGLLLTGGWHAHAIWESHEAVSWPTAQALVEETRLEQARNGCYCPHVLYRYSVNGQVYTRARVIFGNVCYRSVDAQIEDLGRFKAGTPIGIRVHPSRPGVSVIYPEKLRPDTYTMAAVGLIVGTLLLLFALRMYRSPGVLLRAFAYIRLIWRSAQARGTRRPS